MADGEDSATTRLSAITVFDIDLAGEWMLGFLRQPNLRLSCDRTD